jgi:tRNA A-37 threonylcarbamoyl transferase component Bud32
MTLIFQRVDRFEIVRRLGRGGMADVFLARDTVTDREVALKILDIASDRDAQEALAAERRGALLQERLCALDPHVPTVYAHGEAGEIFFISMEYVDGEDLSSVIRRGTVPADRAVEIAIELCDALSTAHSTNFTADGETFHGVIHGDIKPKNIRITPTGAVKVLDFGIAKALTLSRKLTRNDFGSVAYSSPERLDSGEVDVHSDLWSVAVVLYEMLAGHQPYQEVVTRRLEEAIRHRREPLPLPPICPEALQKVVMHALAADVTRRYQSAAAFKADLVAVREKRPTIADLDRAAGVETTRSGVGRTVGEGFARPDAAGPAVASTGATEATRRTGATGVATRRTAGVPAGGPNSGLAAGSAGVPAGSPMTGLPIGGPNAGLPAVVQDAGSKRKDAAGPPPTRWYRARRVFRLAILTVLVLSGLNEISILSAASDLRAELPFKQQPDMDDVWRQYERLRERSNFGFGVAPVAGPLRSRLVHFADRIIANYRSERPTVRERDWQDASTYLSRALAIDDDAAVRARLRYCEGHLHRISGEARLGRREEDAQKLLNDAIVLFEEASRLNPRWPDPYLGLSRTYIYGLDDLEKGADAMERARQAGYKPGNRETAQLADGYRKRGDRLWREAQAVRGLEQEEQILERAAEADRKAIELYEQIVGFGDAARNINATERHLGLVEARLREKREFVWWPF